MRLDVNKLSSAVRLALSLGAVATVGTISAQAQTATDQQKSQSLETIVVTGSNIRRVDVETANPVVTVDRAQIEKSGKVTLGDLIQQLPAMAGAATNPNVNNGGGTGASTISLRGLGSQRSLLLINGHRVATQLQDLNMIPASSVERIDVLTDGASAIYGSDAIAGVVNVITRTNYQGAEFEADYGISDHDDGERKGFRFLFGQSTDKGSIMAGVNYNHQDAISAANRDYSKNALYVYQGSFYLGGSSRTPTGTVSLPANLKAQFGCSRVTRNAGAAGSSLSDYHCYDPSTEAFNYQAIGNYDLTPSERTGLFVLGNYKLTDNVEAYMEVFHNKTTSKSQIAPLPLDAQTDAFVISEQNYYNPFGTAFGQDPLTGTFYKEYRERLLTLGTRRFDFQTSHDLVTAGFKGTIGDTSWSWNGDFSYGHLSQELHEFGFIDYSLLKNQLGPSFQDTDGVIKCGTPGNVLAGCVPLNIFNINDPNTISELSSAQQNPFRHFLYQTKSEEVSANGNLFDLPAGPMQLAIGGSHRKEYLNTQADSSLEGHLNNAGSLVCHVSQSICSGSGTGSYNVREAYAELLVPLLKDMPFAHSLNLDLGDRYSKYNLFGNTNNWKVALEYRPIEDLLLRGTVSKVFRAPLLSDLYRGAAGSSPTATDPCNNLAPGETNAACQYIVGPFQSTGTSQVNAVSLGSTRFAPFTAKLQPENGKSFDYGFVYDPHWIEGLSVSGDVWRISLDNLITGGAGSAQLILNTCYDLSKNNGIVSPLCTLITRIPNGESQGQIGTIYETNFNIGHLSTKGVDLAGHYRWSGTPFGNFNFGLQTTYIAQYDVNDGLFTQGIAGHFDKSFGNFARWRALANVDWNWGPWNATWQARYIGHVTIGYANSNLGPSADQCGCYPENGSPNAIPIYHYGSFTYHNISGGYTIEPLNTSVQVGVDNAGDKKPPIFFQQNVINANTDVNTYDTAGRFYWAKVTVKF